MLEEITQKLDDLKATLEAKVTNFKYTVYEGDGLVKVSYKVGETNCIDFIDIAVNWLDFYNNLEAKINNLLGGLNV